jgi:DNA ligase D-like protein (predicted 3'-phosphoesterase)
MLPDGDPRGRSAIGSDGGPYKGRQDHEGVQIRLGNTRTRLRLLAKRLAAGRAGVTSGHAATRPCASKVTHPRMDPVTDPASSRRAFVLHEHRRPRHHFDLRLEESGVLRSWALPRGLPVSPEENRLAIEVADHDLDHLTYQDTDKSIADHGWWEEHDRNERRILFTLHGQESSQRYALIRTASDWLLHVTRDQPVA